MVPIFCSVVSRSRRVMVLFLTVAKSTVIPYGVPSSSFLAYLLPIVADESSTLDATPFLRSCNEISLIIGSNSLEFEIGTTSALIGATSGGNPRT